MPCVQTTTTLPGLGCCPEPVDGYIQVRRWIAGRANNYHSVCNLYPNGFSQPEDLNSCRATHKMFLHYIGQPPFTSPVTINRYTYAPLGSALQGGSTADFFQYFTDEISGSGIFSDLETLYNAPWPEPPGLTYRDPPFGGTLTGQMIQRWFIRPEFDSIGNVVLPVTGEDGSPLQDDHNPRGIFNPNTRPIGKLVLTDFSGTIVNGELTDEANFRWGLLRAEGVAGISKTKAQIYNNGPSMTACLYDRLDGAIFPPPSGLGPGNEVESGAGPKVNCREIFIPTGVWIDVPAPSTFRYRTILDPSCQCLP
jgi:hypothetical protein